jgi:hypothetical protein
MKLGSAELKLIEYEYSELNGTDRRWALGNTELENINLLVGKNASGKTRFLSSIYGFGMLLTRPPTPLYESGIWKLKFRLGRVVQTYEVTIESHAVEKEKFIISGETKLERDKNGAGWAWSEQLKQRLHFKISTDVLALSSKVDELQHPFLMPINAWVKRLRMYSFGSDFGKGNAIQLTEDEILGPPIENPNANIDPNQVVRIYYEGFRRFGEKFDKMILEDMNYIGYSARSVNCKPMSDMGIHLPAGSPISARGLLLLSIQEEEMDAETRQHEMSTGMYRSLALFINVNFNLLLGHASAVLIDDIGEGLDYDRSTRIIRRLIEKCRKTQMQLIMTTNDRFVMNEVDLSYWHVVLRDGHLVNVLDYKNSREIFDDFKVLGLSNFDFFSSKFYSGNLR